MEVSRLKEQLLRAQHALVKQTQICQELVKKLTLRAQKKDSRYLYEKNLRENQLVKVLRALLLMEARLKQEQKCIAHQLNEKDVIIQKQKKYMNEILSSQYCRNCSRVYNSGLHLENVEYITNYQESCYGSTVDSGELITLSDKNPSSNISYITDNSSSNEIMQHDHYQKNNEKQSLGSRMKKTLPRKRLETNFETFEIRSNVTSPVSNEENTSDDYDNFDSLPSEYSVDQVSVKSQENKETYHQESLVKGYNDHNFDTTINLSFSESNITVIHNIPTTRLRSTADLIEIGENLYKSKENNECRLENKVSESVLTFDVDGESNEKWYVSASDQEDDQQKNIYRNNPVLECVNQILLQNINDSLSSPPASPKIEKKLAKNNRKKIDSEKLSLNKEHYLNELNLKDYHNSDNYDDYETPIQKRPNFYETPQSIYSNDYEQIHSKCCDTSSNISLQNYEQERYKLPKSDVIRKNKILRVPPTLPPKPVNLQSKYRIQINSLKFAGDKISDSISLDSEPDYCSISELNLPTNKLMPTENFQATTEIDAPVSKDIQLIDKVSQSSVENSEINHYNSVSSENKNILAENMNMGIQTTILTRSSNINSYISLCDDIPKLPSVSEIIIPEETVKKIITRLNYETNSQLPKTIINSSRRKPIKVGSSVSSLIMGFNNKELIYEMNEKSIKFSPQNETMSNNVQNLNCQFSTLSESDSNHEDFNFSQNFEEFKLDDSEIEEYALNTIEREEEIINENEIKSIELETDPTLTTFRNTRYLRLIDEKGADISLSSLRPKVFIEQLQRCNGSTKQLMTEKEFYDWNNESTYDHFLECTGLSSKSILMPSTVTDYHKNSFKSKNITINSKTTTDLEK